MTTRTATPTLSRRSLLKILMGSAMSLAFASPQSGEQQLRRTIPASGEGLPAMGLGTAHTFDVGPGDRARVEEVLRRFVDMGGEVVDTSPMYGRAEVLVGDLATGLGVQDRLFLATKVWTQGREAGIRQMTNSMAFLRTQRIDLMQVHNLLDTQTHLATLRDWKARGRIRYVGVTHYRTDAHQALERVIRNHPLDYVQFNYSILTREAEQRLLPLCTERGVAVIVNRPFEAGALFARTRGRPLPPWAVEFDCESWAQFFLKFILSHPAVTHVIPATAKPEHLSDNMRAGLGRLPDTAMRERMARHVAKL